MARSLAGLNWRLRSDMLLDLRVRTGNTRLGSPPLVFGGIAANLREYSLRGTADRRNVAATRPDEEDTINEQ